jgi:hypothetical protein
MWNKSIRIIIYKFIHLIKIYKLKKHFGHQIYHIMNYNDHMVNELFIGRIIQKNWNLIFDKNNFVGLYLSSNWALNYQIFFPKN